MRPMWLLKQKENAYIIYITRIFIITRWNNYITDTEKWTSPKKNYLCYYEEDNWNIFVMLLKDKSSRKRRHRMKVLQDL